MPRSSKLPPLDKDVFVEVGGDLRQVICKVCRSRDIKKLVRRCHVAGHIQSKKHQKNLQRAAKMNGQQIPLRLGTIKLPQSTSSLPLASLDLEMTHPDVTMSSALPMPPPFNVDSGDSEVPLSQLWDEFQAERTILVDDYFDEIQRSIESGESIFSTVLPPLEDELELEDADGLDLVLPNCENYGIDVDAIASKTSRSTKSKGGVHVSANDPLYPWTSMPEFLTHVLFSSPRLRFSQAQKAAVLTWAKDLGAPEVPSMYAIKKTQERFMKLLGTPTEKVTAASGTVFYLNAISKAIAMDFANPLTRFAMQEYPEDGQGRMSQVHHGSKMLDDLPDGLAPPCVRVDRAVYFVNELLQQSTGQYFIPKKFFQARMSPEGESVEPTILALGHKVSKTEEGFVVDLEMIIVPVSTFFNTFEDLRCRVGESGIQFTASSIAFSDLMPNPLREKSGGRMVYTVPLIVFMDDVSGNISKQWNKHHVIYVSNGLLPRQMLEQEFSIRFISSSPHATPMELMQGMKDSIQQATDNPIITFDVKHQEEVALIPYNLIVASDNPMQAEECSHGGLRCNYLCRTCKVGGTNAEKKTDKGYISIFQCGELRTPEDTRAQVKHQIELAKLSGGTEKVKNAVSKTGIRDNATAAIVDRLLALGKVLRKRTAGRPALSEAEVTARLNSELDALLGGQSLDDRINPLLGMQGLDIHKDTPTEILHTILLGIVKYFWGQTTHILEKGQSLKTFRTRLESVNREGLNSPTLNADYIVRYKGGLVGRHFKSLAQVMPYLIYDLVPEKVLQGWSVIGKLVVLLWHTSIDDIESYLATLSRVIDDFLTISAQCAPSILVTKAKFHFLLHLPMFIRRFGPPILFSTERYESFNHVFRLASIYSNRQAPSRDSCQLFAERDNVKHVVTGGFWCDPITAKWVKAGPGVIKYFDEHPHQRHLLGFPKMEAPEVGWNGNTEIVHPINWKETDAAKCIRSTVPVARQEARFHKATSFTAAKGDKPKVGTHVVVMYDGGYHLGMVKEILVPCQQRITSHVVISLWEFLPELHAQLHVPCIKQLAQERNIVVPPLGVICTVNVQHDCINSRCNSTRAVPGKQERLFTSQTKDLVDHMPTNSYIVNTSSLHNYHWIKAAIPRRIYDQIYAALISDHTPLRLHAAHLLRSKQGKGDVADDGTANHDGVLPTDRPAFDRPNKASRGKGKEKNKAPSEHPNGLNAHVPPPLSYPAYIPTHTAFNDRLHYNLMPCNPPQAGPSVPYGGAPPAVYYPAPSTAYYHR
ncbi:hypothetical protein L210DRAFT_3679452 [Boletus edulis BED1]|uniref:Uncharacterized protein n=1 Tax=Boletus edulis BED1 TaxID=1328754 RepID=A0AAD4BS55_BOLED|nr:hypothetical protein L210DRAFT_3679452 [Boletus edulis BED1]